MKIVHVVVLAIYPILINLNLDNISLNKKSYEKF